MSDNGAGRMTSQGFDADGCLKLFALGIVGLAALAVVVILVRYWLG